MRLPGYYITSMHPFVFLTKATFVMAFWSFFDQYFLVQILNYDKLNVFTLHIYLGLFFFVKEKKIIYIYIYIYSGTWE